MPERLVKVFINMFFKDNNNKYIFALLVLGLIIRVGYILTLENSVYWEDETDYMRLSESIVTGNGFVNPDGQPTAFRAPGYPVFLAALNVVGIKGILPIRIAQAFISVLTLFLLYLLACRIFNPVAGIVSLGLGAVYPYFIFISGTVLATVLYSFLLVLFAYIFHIALSEKNKWMLLLSGIVLGLTILTRSAALVILGVIFLWLFITFRKDLKIFAGYSLLLTGACLIVISPWIVRNYTKLNVANISSNGGRNLWLGNNKNATINSGSDLVLTDRIEKKLQSVHNESEIDNVYNHEAVRYIRENPGRFLKLTLAKAVSFWRLDPSPTTTGYLKIDSNIRWVSILSYGPIFILAVLGFFMMPDSSRKYVLFWVLFACSQMLLHAVYITKVRFRLPLDHFLIFIAGFTIVFLVTKIKMALSDYKKDYIVPLSWQTISKSRHC